MKAYPVPMEGSSILAMIKSVLKKIDKQGKAMLTSGTPWEEGMIKFERTFDGLTQLELNLVNNWISSWRERIIKANGIKPRA